MQKLTHQLAGEIGEALALAKLISLGLHAYISPPGAPGHDIMVVTPERPKSIEVKTRQYIDSKFEIGRWPVNMDTKAEADFFLFIEIGLQTLEPTFYLLNNAQARETYKDNNGNGNCLPSLVRATVSANDFSVLTGDPLAEGPKPASGLSDTLQALEANPNDLRSEIAKEAEHKRFRIVRYASQSIDVFVDGIRQTNTLGNLRLLGEELGVSEYNDSGGERNTRQLGKAVIEAIDNQE